MRILPAFLLLVCFALPGPVAAFEDPDTEASAAYYRAQLERRNRSQRDLLEASRAWSEAENHARRGRWDKAVGAYERAIGFGNTDANLWLALSEAWEGAQSRTARRTIDAAYNALRTAGDDQLKARVLFRLGEIYEAAGNYDQAIAALGDGLALFGDRRMQRHHQDIVDRYAMRMVKSEPEPESDTPRICFQFSRNLQERGRIRYEDYIRFEPDFAGAFSAQGKRLCVEGVSHGGRYKVTVLKGLPDAADHSLWQTESFTVHVPKRTPSLGFRGATQILPRKGTRELPLESVNIDQAELEVLRINDRNLLQLINEGRIGTLLNLGETAQIALRSGERLWQGTLEIESEANRKATTAIPLGEILADPEPGIYVVTAKQPEDPGSRSRQPLATQWMVVSDFGISSYTGGDGLHVFLRSLASARPLEGVELRLYARNNSELGRAVSDADGRVGFAPGLLRGSAGAGPAAVMAFGDADFNFLDLTRPAFDLTDRGVGGRPAPGPIDAYLYTERGVYRPGETVQAVVLLRDDRAEALADTPVTVIVHRPDGTEYNRFPLSSQERKGGHHLELPLAASAQTGQWFLSARVDPDAPPVGRIGFQVEDFVPERMEVALTPAGERLEPGTETSVTVAARFLYGAPAADLGVSGEIVLRQDMNPYPMHKGFKFGLVQEEWRARRTVLETRRTNAEGEATLAVRLDEVPDTTRPLRAVVRASVSEAGGRAVTRSTSLPLRTGDFMIGVKPEFGARNLGRNEEARFQVIAVDRDGASIATQGLVYELFREHYRYRWYYRASRWDYKVLLNDEPRKSDRIDLDGSAPEALAFGLDWGQYRLEVHDPETGIATSVRFQVGWYYRGGAGASASVPDKLEVSLDKAAYKAGETARVHIRPPFAGQVLLTVAGSRLYASRSVAVPVEGSTLELVVEEDWDAGAYVTATAFRPADSAAKRGPARAIGVAWLARDFADRTLAVEIDAPDQVTPRQTVEVAVEVAGAGRTGPAFVTLAAVDEGILQLTEYQSPAPSEHYFGKRRLAVELRDDYGRLIQGAEATVGELRQGGDADAARHLGGLDASSIKTVALFSGIVQLDADGRARVALEIPDFNGRLRLMAVAYDGARLGQAETALTVRDPLVSQITLPRFLAPRDESNIALSLHNLDAPAGEYRLTLEAEGAVAFVDRAAADSAFQLGSDERKHLAFTLKGMRVGVAGIAMTLEGPGGLRIERDWELAVRPAQTVTTRYLASRLAPGASASFSDALLEDFVPGSGEVLLTFNNQPDLDVVGLLKSLHRYPYGCVEQTTSRALPLLYVSEVAQSVGIAEDAAAIRLKVQGAIDRIFTMQGSHGGFGMWGWRDQRDEWLTAYAMDFLTQARKKGYRVSGFAYQRGLKWLAGSVASADFRSQDLPARAYALYVLAQAELAKAADLRYLHDVYLSSIPSALGRAQLGAALALYGDGERAAGAFRSARELVMATRERGYLRDYGSRLRDTSAVLYLASATDTDGGYEQGLMDLLVDLRGRHRYTSTQEKAWLVLAAAVLQGTEPFEIALGGDTLAPRLEPYRTRLGPAELAAGVTVANLGGEAVFQGLTVTGVPALDQPAENNGFTIKREFFTLDGEPADLGAVHQSDVLVAVITGEATTRLDHQALIVDLLPGGFELDNFRLAGGRRSDELGWLPELAKTRHIELRDDRYVAALDLQRRKGLFALAYVVRAVSPGTFRMPAVHVEDMYQPNYFARAEMSTIQILPRE